MKTDKFVLAIHVLGAIAIAGCVWLAVGPARNSPELVAVVTGVALWLYGKLGFKPAGPILDRIVAKLAEAEPDRVARLTTRPPPSATMAPTAAQIVIDDQAKTP